MFGDELRSGESWGVQQRNHWESNCTIVKCHHDLINARGDGDFIFA